MPDSSLVQRPRLPIAAPASFPSGTWMKATGVYVILGLATLGLWKLVAAVTMPILFPPPEDVARAFWARISDGTLFTHIGASYVRIISGWAIGCAIAIPFGILAGRLRIVRTLLEPYIEFFRYIPPIAFITLFMIWFGLGELAKVILIVYTAFFTTFLNIMTGAMSVQVERIRAAQCLGAAPMQVFFRVIVPATVPYIVTGMRLSLGLSFMTVVAAEFIAAESGIGYLIFNSRLFAQTDNVFVGIITLGSMGFAANWALKKAISRIAYRYDIKL